MISYFLILIRRVFRNILPVLHSREQPSTCMNQQLPCMDDSLCVVCLYMLHFCIVSHWICVHMRAYVCMRVFSYRVCMTDVICYVHWYNNTVLAASVFAL